MAKNNNLGDFLTDIANAIRAKKGTSESINAQDFASEIVSISTGGGGSTGSAVSKSDVNFYDYDGTLLLSYTKDDFLALSALPDLPTRAGLTCQGWNYTLADAKEYVTSYGVLDIGTMYITDDGKTRLYIKIAAVGRMTVPLYFSQTADSGVTIDWGDGSVTQTLSGTGNVNTTHTYANIGDYVITLKVTSGTLDFGANSSNYSVMGSTGNNGRVYCNMLQKVEIGSSVTRIESNAFRYCHSLTSVAIPSSVTRIGSYAFSSCYSLTSVAMPSGVTRIEGYAFYYCYSLTSVAIPSSVTNIGNSAFYSCSSLASIVIPNSVTSIGSSAFYSCGGMAYYDFREHTSVPTLSSNNAFSSIPSDCKIVVPDSLYDSWIIATNWSKYASNIVKAS